MRRFVGAALTGAIAIVGSMGCHERSQQSATQLELRKADVIRLAARFANEQWNRDARRAPVLAVAELKELDGGQPLLEEFCGDYGDVGPHEHRNPRATQKSSEADSLSAVWTRMTDGGFLSRSPSGIRTEDLYEEPATIFERIDRREADRALVWIRRPGQLGGCYVDVLRTDGGWELGKSCGCWFD